MIHKDVIWTGEPNIGGTRLKGFECQIKAETVWLLRANGSEAGEAHAPPFGGHGQNTCLAIRLGNKYGKRKSKRYQGVCVSLLICF